MSTQPYFHALSISYQNPFTSLRLGRFHPRAYARGPQRRFDRKKPRRETPGLDLLSLFSEVNDMAPIEI